MIVGVRRMLVWATAVASIVSAALLALGEVGVPHFDAPAPPGSIGTGPTTPAR